MSLFSEETLSHYGIPGQKKGIRRWQYPDGRFNEEGKERYFGKSERDMTREREASDPDSKYTLGKGVMNSIKSGYGVSDNDSKTAKNMKIIGGIATSILFPPLLKVWSSEMGAKKANRNAKKLGIVESELKSSIKNLLNLNNLATDNYNIRRSEGQGRLRAYFGANIIDNLKDTFTLGKASYDRKENRGLEHSIY